MTEPRIIHVGKKFSLEQRQIATGDGREYTLDVVKHPGSVAILAMLDDDTVLLERIRRPATGKVLLEIPAGTRDPGEDPTECARRELIEETGYRAQEMRPLLAFYTSPGFCTEFTHIFLATGLTPGEHAREVGEEIELEPMKLTDCLAKIASGEIDDVKTITAVLYYERFADSDGKQS